MARPVVNTGIIVGPGATITASNIAIGEGATVIVNSTDETCDDED